MENPCKLCDEKYKGCKNGCSAYLKYKKKENIKNGRRTRERGKV